MGRSLAVLVVAAALAAAVQRVGAGGAEGYTTCRLGSASDSASVCRSAQACEQAGGPRGGRRAEFERVCLGAGTERAWSSPMSSGGGGAATYHCACCGAELYHGVDKFDSGSGWPSFTQPASPTAVGVDADDSCVECGPREEVFCANCGAHLGHVFADGPPPTGRRHCINAVCLHKELGGEGAEL